MKFNLSMFSFIACAFGIIFKKLLSNPRSQRFIPMFSSKSSKVLDFTFRSSIHFELIFVYDMT